MTAVVFYLFAAGLLASAVGVVLAKSPLRAALLLISALASLAVLFVLLDASFVAAMQRPSPSHETSRMTFVNVPG